MYDAGYSETISFFYLSFHPSRFHHSSLVYPLDLALAKFRLATGRRAWRRRDFNWKRVKPRARAHTSPHGERSRRVRGGRGNATSHSTTTRVNKQCLSSNDAARMTDIRGSEAARKRKRAARLNKENEKHLERSGEEGGRREGQTNREKRE